MLKYTRFIETHYFKDELNMIQFGYKIGYFTVGKKYASLMSRLAVHNDTELWKNFLLTK
jgi:hypothetical protein